MAVIVVKGASQEEGGTLLIHGNWYLIACNPLSVF